MWFCFEGGKKPFEFVNILASYIKAGKAWNTSLDIKRKSVFKMEMVLKIVRLDEVIQELRPGPALMGEIGAKGKS